MSKYKEEVNRFLIGMQEGDKSQVAALYDLTANHLRAIALRYLFEKSNCDDVLSETFCRVIQYVNTFNPEHDGYNWICKIVENVAYAFNRQLTETRSNCIALDALGEIGTLDVGAVTRSDLDRAFATLTDKQREVLQEYFYNGLTYDEIAEKYGVAKSAVHKRMMGAFKKIKKLLSDDPDNIGGTDDEKAE